MDSSLTPGTIVLIVIWIASAIVGAAMYLANPGKTDLGALTVAVIATLVWAFTR